MSSRSKKVVVFWPKENKVGVESLSSVPENSRFVGACTPVRFHGDKKFYPAKILLISDDQDKLDEEVEKKEREIVAADLKKQQAAAAGKAARAARSKKNPDASVATERDVALALGNKAPVPKSLEGKHKENKKASKDAKTHQNASLRAMDVVTLSDIRKDLFSAREAEQAKSTSKDSSDDGSEGVSDNDDGHGESDEECDAQLDSASSVWCSCQTCKVLKKYDGPIYANFLRDITSLYERSQDSDKVKYLELLPIPAEEKQVELVKGKGVMISATVKNQLKVDFRNKGSSLAREALFALYGREAFKVLPVTGKGQKKGSYTVPKTVLTAVCSFVNKNVDSAQQIKSSELVKLINKRAPEWRKTPSPKKKGVRKPQKCVKVTSTSPFKVVPILSPVPSPPNSPPPLAETPQKSPGKSAAPSPARAPDQLAAKTPPKRPSPMKPSSGTWPGPVPSPAKHKSPSKAPIYHSAASSAPWQGPVGPVGYQPFSYCPPGSQWGSHDWNNWNHQQQQSFPYQSYPQQGWDNRNNWGESDPAFQNL